jgi:hypothetical protein
VTESDVSSLPGLVFNVLVLSVATTYPLALLLLWRYKRRVEVLGNESAHSATRGGSPPPGVATPFSGTADTLYAELRGAPRRSAALQGAVGASLACYLAVLMIASGHVSVSLARLAVVGLTTFWPGVLAIVLTMGTSRRQRLVMLLIAAVGYTALGAVASATGSAAGVRGAALLWTTLNVPVTIVLAALLTRQVRAIAPLIFLVTFVSIGGAGAMLELLQRAPAVAMPIERLLLVDLGLGSSVAFVLVVLCGFVLAGLCGVWLLRILGAAYARNRIGDRGITLSAIWLIYIAAFTAFELFFGGTGLVVLGLASFPLYLALTSLGHRLFFAAPRRPAPTLLLLRVFWSKGRTPQLFHTISRHWRHVGPLTIIGWKDVAGATAEPNEFIAFLRRRADEMFVTDPAATLAALDAAPAQRDPDGRFRCQQRLCFRDTWLPTVEGLIQRSAVILVDLRALEDKSHTLTNAGDAGTGDAPPGIAMELGALKRLHALDRTVLIHNGSDIVPLTLQREGIDPSSIAQFELAGEAPRSVAGLLRLLADRCLSASSRGQSVWT